MSIALQLIKDLLFVFRNANTRGTFQTINARDGQTG